MKDEMNKYAEYFEYLVALGIPKDVCKRICEKYCNAGDIEGLLDCVLLCEAIADECVD